MSRNMIKKMRRVIITVIVSIAIPGVTYAQVGERVDSIYNAAKKELADTHVENAEKMFVDLYAEYKDYRAMNALALICYNRGDKKRALSYWRQAAKKGDHAAQNNFAQCLEFGIECEKDLAQALYWARLADEGGYAGAKETKIRILNKYHDELQLEVSSLDSLSICRQTKDFTSEFRIASRLAEHGIAAGYMALGDICFNGEINGVKDYDAAIKYYEQAIDGYIAGNPWRTQITNANAGRVYYNLGNLYGSHRNDQVTASYYYGKSVNLGYPKADDMLNKSRKLLSISNSPIYQSRIIPDNPRATIIYDHVYKQSVDVLAEFVRKRDINVQLIENKDKQALWADFKKHTQKSENVSYDVLFYVGKGAEVNGHKFLLPPSFDMDKAEDAMLVEREGTDLELLMSRLPRQKYVIFDALKTDGNSRWSQTVGLTPGTVLLSVNSPKYLSNLMEHMKELDTVPWIDLLMLSQNASALVKDQQPLLEFTAYDRNYLYGSSKISDYPTIDPLPCSIDALEDFVLGMQYSTGFDAKTMEPVEVDYSKAFNYFNSAIKKGVKGEPLCWMARMCEHGLGLERDTDKAMALYLEALQPGAQSGEAAYRYAMHKGIGDICEYDKKEAMDKYLLSTMMGFHNAKHSPYEFSLQYPDADKLKKKAALVIGNGNYERLNKLDSPQNDAEDMAAMLEEIGFKVFNVVLDGTYEDLTKDINEYKKYLRTSKTELSFVYYSGHGQQVDGRDFIITVDQKYIPLEEAIPENKDIIKITVFDACRDNKVMDIKAPTWELVPTNSIVAYASSTGRTSDFGTGRHSAYTEVLLEVIKRKGLGITALFNQTARLLELKAGTLPITVAYGFPINVVINQDPEFE